MTHDISVYNDINELTIYVAYNICRNVQKLYEFTRFSNDSQVRKYTPFIVVEANGDKLAGSTGFNDVTG